MTRPAGFFLRHPLFFYLLLWAGVIFVGAFGYHSAQRQADLDRGQNVANCVAGNERSQLQLEGLLDQRARTEAFDFSTLARTPELGDEIRSQSLEQIGRQITRVPFVDCRTGERVPPPIPPTKGP